MKAISYQGYVPIRREPSEKAEMVSQILFGETFRVLETSGKWALIALDFDLYEGWVWRGSIAIAEPSNGAEAGGDGHGHILSAPLTTIMDLDLSRQLILPAGSMWPVSPGKTTNIQGRRFEVLTADPWIKPGKNVDPEVVGKSLISIPYLWGGRSGFGFDCSGLVQMLCRMMGNNIPRDSNQQAELGSTVNFIHEIRKGDLAFFDNAEGEIAHVGMIMDAGRILHCHNQVRMDKLDQQGIYCSEREDYTHKLRIIKRHEN